MPDKTCPKKYKAKIVSIEFSQLEKRFSRNHFIIPLCPTGGADGGISLLRT
jgi:hypothetical protein